MGGFYGSGGGPWRILWFCVFFVFLRVLRIFFVVFEDFLKIVWVLFVGFV